MPNFKPNPNGMKPSGFKMKGWGGYQGSPVKKGLGDLKLVKDLKEAGKQIKEDFGKGGKVYKEIKEDVKKLKSKLGFKEKEKERTGAAVPKGEEIDIKASGPDSYSLEAPTVPQDPRDLIKVDDKIPVIGDDWKSGTGDDPWKYRKIDGGYQTKRGEHGDIINVTDPTTKAYQKIGEKIFDIEPVEIEPVKVTEQPKRKKSSPYTPGYIKGYKGYGE